MVTWSHGGRDDGSSNDPNPLQEGARGAEREVRDGSIVWQKFSHDLEVSLQCFRRVSQPLTKSFVVDMGGGAELPAFLQPANVKIRQPDSLGAPKGLCTGDFLITAICKVRQSRTVGFFY